MGCPVLSATCGGCTFVVSALSSREPPFSLMNIGFGQGAVRIRRQHCFIADEQLNGGEYI